MTQKSAHLEKIIKDHNRTANLQVVFVDIEKYSKRSTKIQMKVIDSFTKCLSESLNDTSKKFIEYAQNNEINFRNDIIKLPTGDGAAIIFSFDGLHDIHLYFAKTLLKSIYNHNKQNECEKFLHNGWCDCHSNFNVRIGVSEGKGIIFRDLEGNYNVAGSVINLAARVMSLGDSNQIIFTEEAYRQIIDMVDASKLNGHFEEFTDIKIKHGIKINVYQYKDQNRNFINSTPPKNLLMLKGANKFDDFKDAIKIITKILNPLDKNKVKERTELTLKRIDHMTGEVNLLAIAATTYFRRRHKLISKKFCDKLLKKKFHLKVILLNPYSESAKLRAARESGLDIDEFSDILPNYYEDNINFFRDITDTIKEIKQLSCEGAKIECRLTNFEPIISAMITKDFVYIDTLSLGRVDEQAGGKLRASFPILEFPRKSEFGNTAKSHFDYYWKYGITLDEFEDLKNEFKNKFFDYSFTNYRLIKQHESWISIDPVIGCSNGCCYCVLQTSFGNKTEPKVVYEPSVIPGRLKNNKYFHNNENKILSFFNYTDGLLPENQDTLLESISQIEKSIGSKAIKAIVIPTKSQVTNSFLDKLKEIFDEKKIIFFLSYSGLDEGLEPKDRERYFEKSSIALRSDKYDFKIVHYWRPIIPSYEDDNIKKVYDFVQKYTSCSVVVGLKASKALNKYYDSCKLIDFTRHEKKDAGEYFPVNFFKTLKSHQKKTSGNVYPVYRHASCAISYLLKLPDYNGTMFRPICPLSTERDNEEQVICPQVQQDICRDFRERKIKEWENDEDKIKDQILKLMPDIKFFLDKRSHIIRVLTPIRQEDVILLTQTMGCPVKADFIKRTNQYVGSIFQT